jgi:hypothetical protein
VRAPARIIGGRVYLPAEDEHPAATVAGACLARVEHPAPTTRARLVELEREHHERMRREAAA